MSRGVLLYAHNNDLINYAKLAYHCANRVHQYLDVPVCLVTDQKTSETLTEKECSTFDIIKYIDTDKTENVRSYIKRDNTRDQFQFNNRTRSSAFDLTPWDETLMIDTDYMLCNDSLNKVWGSNSSMMMNTLIDHVYSETEIGEQWIGIFSIPLYWATVCYFKKNDETNHFFDLVEYVKSHYNWFAKLYSFSPKLYRNDHSFSVANHLMGGFVDPLPIHPLIFAWDTARVSSIDGDSILFEYQDYRSKFGDSVCPVLVSNMDVHCLNKETLIDALEA